MPSCSIQNNNMNNNLTWIIILKNLSHYSPTLLTAPLSVISWLHKSVNVPATNVTVITQPWSRYISTRIKESNVNYYRAVQTGLQLGYLVDASVVGDCSNHHSSLVVTTWLLHHSTLQTHQHTTPHIERCVLTNTLHTLSVRGIDVINVPEKK